MDKIKDLLSRHKVLFVMCAVTLLFIIIMLYVFLSIFISGNNSYGDRLDGIEEVEIAKDKMNDIASKVEDNDDVSEASVRLQGKIIYINIVFNDDVSLDDAKEIAKSTLDEFDDDEKSYYDFGYFLTQVESDENGEYFKVTGSMHASSDDISWIKS